MSRLFALGLTASLLVASACTDGDSDSDVAAACTTSVALFPADGDSRAYYRTSIEASFSPAAATDATVTVTGPSGEVSGTSNWEGKRLVFTPSAPLTPGAQYTTDVSYTCGGETKNPSVTWNVSEVGSPTGLDTLTGSAYALDLANARFVRPEGIGALLGSFLTFDLMIGVEGVSGADITMIGALGVEGSPGVQEPCQQTIPFPTADISDNPYFQLGPQRFEIDVEGQAVVIDDLFLSGSFAPDASYIDGAVLAGIVDTRPLKGLVDDSPDAPDSAVCDLAASLQVECVPCPDGQAFCLELLADSIGAARLSNSLERIDDPCLKEECAADCGG